jgi:hypothetical protein
MSDKEDKSIDILGIKPFGDAINTVAKGTMDGVGAFLSRICLPAAEEFGLLLRDKISYYRIANLAKVVDKAKKKIGDFGKEASGDMSPKLLKEIVEESSWVEDETLQNMWAGLLAGTAIKSDRNDDALIYTNILKGLSSFQANLINLVYSDPRICSIRPPINIEFPRFDNENILTYSFKRILKLSHESLSEVVPIANVTADEILNDRTHHVIAIGRFKPQILALKVENLIANYMTSRDEKRDWFIQFWPSQYGLDFYMRCSGYSIYPLEAYITIRQEWCKAQGIDPFNVEMTDIGD